MRQLAPIFTGITYDRLDSEGGLQWPCPTEDHPGTQFLHENEMDSGMPGYFAPVDHIPPAEPTDSEYPLILTTGRRRSTYHTGTQTGRATGFELLVPSELAEINPFDAEQMELTDGQKVIVSSRRGSVEVPIKVTDTSPHGTVFMSFAFPDLTQTNRLTSDAYDFITETPEFKACAIRIDKIEASSPAAD
jgi:predicted molibdopterin-dependent oxidoreductase YjgC